MFKKTFQKTNDETKSMIETFLKQFNLDQALREGYLPITSDAALRGNCSRLDTTQLLIWPFLGLHTSNSNKTLEH